MTIPPEEKPLATLREEAVDQLIMNYGHGKLSLNAFEQRLDKAFDAEDHQALKTLTVDLELEVDAEYIRKKKQELGLASPSADAPDVEHVVSVFSANERTGQWTVPRRLRIITIFGAADLDFSEAKFSGPETRVTVLCLFGAVDLFVREDIDTSVNTFCVFGAVDNKAPASGEPARAKLLVRGLVLFGAIDAKIKKTWKERLLAFAGTVRGLFGSTRASDTIVRRG